MSPTPVSLSVHTLSRFLLLAAIFVATLAGPASAQEPGQLTVSSQSGLRAGFPTTFSWSGPLRGPERPGGVSCGALDPIVRWGISDLSGSRWSNSHEGNTATFTPPRGGLYNVNVCVSYQFCRCGAGTGFVETYAPGQRTIFSVTPSPDPVFVDRGAELMVQDDFPWETTTTAATWNFGDGTSCSNCTNTDSFHSGRYTTHVWTQPGTYDASVTLTSSPEGTATKTFRVVVKPDPPIVSAALTPSNPSAGQPVQFNANIAGSERGRTIRWDFGDGTTSTELNPVHTFAAADDHLVTLTVTNAWGTGRWVSTLTIRPGVGGSPPTSADFSFSPLAPVTRQQVAFTDKSKGSINRWRWNFEARIPPGPLEGASLSYSQNPTFTYDTTGRKNVELTVSNAFGSKSILLFVEVLRHDQPPVANFVFEPFRVVVGQPVTFTDASAGGTSWLWDLGEDGATSTEQHPRYTYRTGGQKGVTLKVSNAFGSGTVTKFFPCHGGETPVEPLAANFTWSPRSPKAAEEVQFTDLSTGSPERWSWVVSDGARSEQRNFKHTFAAPGEYGVSLRIDKGTESKIFVQIVNVAAATGPVPNFTWTPGTPKPSEVVSFSNSSQNATSYLWEFGDGATSTAVNPQHAFAEEKTYRVKLTANGPAGTQSITKDLIVSNQVTLPVANFRATPNPANLGKVVRFTDTSTGTPTEWRWDFGDLTPVRRERHPEHIFTFPGTFLVRLTVSNVNGTDSVQLPVVISKEILLPQADFTWSPAEPAAGQAVEFTDNSLNEPKGWHWNFGDGGSANGRIVSHTFPRKGSYNVTLEASNEAGLSTVNRTVIVSEKALQADFRMTPANAVLHVPVVFEDISAGSPDRWQWLVDRVVRGTAPRLEWTFHTGGEHVVELKVGRDGLESIRQRPIIVPAPPVASFRVTGGLRTGSPITFTDTSQGNPTKWHWFIDDKVVSDRAFVAHTFTRQGTGRVRLQVENAVGGDSVTKTFEIRTSESERPKIVGVLAKYGPCFFSNMPAPNEFSVDVDWRKQFPVHVGFEVNGVAEPDVLATSTKTTVLSLEGSRLTYSDTGAPNKLTFTAIAGGGVASDAAQVDFFGHNTPGYLRNANSFRVIREPARMSYAAGIYIPTEPFEGFLTLPDVLGGWKIGVSETQFKFDQIRRTDCTIGTNIEIAGGIKLGNSTVGIKGTAAPPDTRLTGSSRLSGPEKYSVSLEAFVKAEQEVPLLKASPIMAVPCRIPFAGYVCEIMQVKLEGNYALGGVWEISVDPTGAVTLESGSGTHAFGVQVTGTVEAGKIKLQAFGGGKTSLEAGPFTQSPWIRKVTIAFQVGVRAVIFAHVAEYTYNSVCVYSATDGWACGAQQQNAGTPRFASNGLAVFHPLPAMARAEAIEEPGAAPVVLKNVSPVASPAAASNGDRSVIVYAGENETLGQSAHRNDVRALRRNSATGRWSESRPVSSDRNGDFTPDVAMTSTGRAVAAWERLKNADTSFADVTTLEQMATMFRDVEIAVSVSDSSGDSWSSVEVLTSNELHDYQPVLTALNDDRVLLSWLRHSPDGSGPQQIMGRLFDGRAWSAEQVIGTDLHGIETIALTSKGDEAQLVVALDRDGSRATANDRDLALFVYRANAWQPRRDVTADAENDHSPLLMYDGDTPRLFWTREGRLVTRTLPDGAIETVRDEAVQSPIVATSPIGVVVIGWSHGGELRARIREQGSNRWSSDVVLGNASGNESSLGGFFTADGMLHLVALATQMENRVVTTTIDGKPVTIEAVPTPARVDLVESVTGIRVDLAARGETIRVEPAIVNPGEAVALSIELQNTGQLGVRDVVVDLRRGSAMIATTTVTGDWAAGETRRVELTTAFDPAATDLTFIVDPLAKTTDVDRANNVAQYSFANRAPQACFQSTAGSGGAPLTIALDAACSADSDGSIVRYSWSFSDSGAAQGASASHTFATAGTHTVVLTATDNMGAVSTHSMSVDVALQTNWRRASTTHSLYLPVVGRAAGLAGSFFVSDLAVVNTDAEKALDLDAVFLPAGRGDSYHKRFTIGGGELLHTRDILARLFSASNGTGSIRLDLSHPHAVAVARTYNDQPAGTAGFSNAAVSSSQAMGDGETAIVLQHWLPGYRTNLGFAEIGGAGTEITATAFDEGGVVIGSEVFKLAAYDQRQFNGLAAFQNRGRIELTVRGGSVLAYVSTVDGKTGDPIYQTADRPPAAATATALLVPVVARLAGANNSTWRTDVRIFNASAVAQRVNVELRTGAGTHAAAFELAAGRTASFDDVVAAFFPQLTGNVGGALHISAAGALLATSRTFNVTAGGTYGLYVPARAAHELIGEGETAYLVQLQENANYRCNFGLTAFDIPGTVSVRAFDASGTTLARKEYSVAAGQNMQVGRVFADMGITEPLDAAGLEVLVTGGRLFVYASVNDNRTGDGSFVEAQR